MSALVLYGLIHLLFLALFVGALLWLEEPTHRLILLALVVAVSVGVTTLVFGVGGSLVGKLAAAAGASACPPLCAWAAFSVAQAATRPRYAAHSSRSQAAPTVFWLLRSLRSAWPAR